MPIVSRSNFFILTGTPGTGKTTLLHQLRADGHACVDETAREVLAHQKAIDGPGLPSKSPLRFVQLMLERSIENFEKAKEAIGPVIFDRAVPDLIAYADRFEVETSEFKKAAQEYLYNQTVFVFSPWKEIFVNDSERKITFEKSLEFHEAILKAYRNLNYKLIEVPFDTVEVRKKFVLQHIDNRPSQ
jgi:predicted ATPase